MEKTICLIILVPCLIVLAFIFFNILSEIMHDIKKKHKTKDMELRATLGVLQEYPGMDKYRGIIPILNMKIKSLEDKIRMADKIFDAIFNHFGLDCKYITEDYIITKKGEKK